MVSDLKSQLKHFKRPLLNVNYVQMGGKPHLSDLSTVEQLYLLWQEALSR